MLLRFLKKILKKNPLSEKTSKRGLSYIINLIILSELTDEYIHKGFNTNQCFNFKEILLLSFYIFHKYYV